MSIRW